MAFLKEDNTAYPEGIYQIERSDPVEGGATGLTNAPLIGLASRTAWLKKTLATAMESLEQKAGLSGPVFKGTPTAPTAAAGIDNLQIANAAFATALTHGIYRRDVTADGAAFTLTRDQCSVGILVFTGTNATGKTVTVPTLTTDTKSRIWVVDNRTSGGGAVTLNPTGGTGIMVLPGRCAYLYMDGASIRRALTDYTDAYLQKCFALAPDATATGEEIVTASWVRSAIAGASGFRTGDIKPTLNGGEAGWLPLMYDGYIGSPTSGANLRAAADCEALFKLIWASIDQGAAPVLGGRGASANADWAANKRIQLPRFAGRVMACAGQGAGLSARYLGGFFGTESVTLLTAHMPAHNHGGSTTLAGLHGHVAWTDNSGNHTHPFQLERDYGGGGPGNAVAGDEPFYGYDYRSTGPAGDHNHTIGVQPTGEHIHNIYAEGGNAAHDNMQPTLAINWMIKL